MKAEDLIKERENLMKEIESLRTRVVELEQHETAQQRQQAASLLNKGQKAAGILESINEIFFALNQEWRFSFLNSKAVQLFQTMLGESAELVGQDIWEIFPKFFGTTLEQALRQAMTEQVAVEYEEFYPLLERWFEIRVYPATVGLSIYFRDVSERKEVEAELLRQHEEINELNFKLKNQADQLENILEHLNEGISVFDKNFHNVRLNKAGRQILGWQENQPRYNNLNQYLANFNIRSANGESLPLEEWPVSRALQGETFRDQIILFTGADGKDRQIIYSGFPVCDDSGEVQLGVVVYRDVTREQEVNRLKDKFLAIASHELRTPLTSIKGYAQLLERSMKKREKLFPASSLEAAFLERDTRAVNSIIKQSSVMSDLISEMLDFSRIQTGKLALRREANVDVEALARRVIEQQQDTTEHYLQLEIGNPPLLCYCDGSRIEQVLSNLLANAISYSEPDKLITVGLNWQHSDDSGRELIVWVRDEGYGINPDEQPYIFDQFYCVRNSSHDYSDSLGLGLFISREIISKHGGRMWFESQLGVGSTFYFSLPDLQPENLIKC